jgi:hypothetical protein
MPELAKFFSNLGPRFGARFVTAPLQLMNFLAHNPRCAASVPRMTCGSINRSGLICGYSHWSSPSRLHDDIMTTDESVTRRRWNALRAVPTELESYPARPVILTRVVLPRRDGRPAQPCVHHACTLAPDLYRRAGPAKQIADWMKQNARARNAFSVSRNRCEKNRC